MVLIYFIVGGGRKDEYTGEWQYYDDIYKYEAGEWSPAGNMKTERGWHAVSILLSQNMNSLETLCHPDN